MQKIKNKEPIHINISKRGKLRRIIRYKQDSSLPDSSTLVVSPTTGIQNNSQHLKQRQNFFMRKYAIKTRRQSSFQSELTNEPETGSFRAIHTACPYDSIKGFPLRSVTPIKPFRRGIRSVSINQKALQLHTLQGDRPVTRISRGLKDNLSMNNPQTELQGLITVHTPEATARDFGMNNNEEFYMYKDPRNEKKASQKQGPESARVVSGTKIEPFRKYNIRQFHKGIKMHQPLKNKHNVI